MRKEEAAQKLNDGMSRKFLLDPTSNTLHISEKYEYDRDDTHENMAISQDLPPDKVLGGMLRIDKGGFIFRMPSTTVPPASNLDIENFDGNVEIF